jgi:lysyl-tRNA synthetase, class II
MSENNILENVNTADLIAVRKAKLDALVAAGHNPYAQNWTPTHTSTEALATWAGEPTEAVVSIAGRMTAFRLMGKASFIKLLDRSGRIQAYVTREEIGEAAYEEFKRLDVGDIIGIQGTLFVTKTGEVTIRAKEYRLVSKALRPLPEKWHGLSDEEQIYRQRYLDLVMNDVSRDHFFKRSQILEQIRKFLWGRGFTEMETPFLQSVPGGAAAKPFKTHMNALSCDFYVRISLELYLKRMLVAGFDRVFEMGRIFRNEGISRRHNPEFTMIELYQAYTDYRGMMSLIYDLIQHLCTTVLGTTQIRRYDGQVIELGGTWKEIRYRDAIIEHTGDAHWFKHTKAHKIEKAKAMGLEVHDGMEDFEVTGEIFGKRIEPNFIQPTFVTHLPRELCPLAKLNPEDPTVIDVFELCINGQEIAPAYSEQNDPILQRKLFLDQVGEEVQNMDEDFLVALEHGMPPAGGMGIGIDRLCMLLLGVASIRDVILFPSMRPDGNKPA